MRLRTALNEYKRDRARQFPEESPTTAGAFSGHGDRLVHVGRDGAIRDYSAALSGLYGIDRSRFAIEADGDIRWFDDLELVRQHYYRETSLVETEFDAGGYTIHQFDLTIGRAHLTHVELQGAIPTDAHLTAFVTLAPEGRETRVGRLIHEDAGPGNTHAVEVYHRNEHDYITASTGLSDVRGQIPERFDEMLSSETFTFPREAVLEQYEDTHLSSDIVVSAPLERDGRAVQTTLVTQLSDHQEVSREEALADLRNCALEHESADDIRTAARERAEISVSNHIPRQQTVRADLRALSLLQAPAGSHIAGPEFDPFYAHSGGYGYTWFRDEAEISRYLLDAGSMLDIDVRSQLRTVAAFFCETQLSDGSWPHRAWAVDGSLAPGWANARVENSDKPEYQADQTASVVTYLASVLDEHRDVFTQSERERIQSAIADGVEALDDSLAADGLPEPCQNAWENMVGRFVHTAATFLEAYATVANTPLDPSLCKHATGQAMTVYQGLDALWSQRDEQYALRLTNGERDVRADSGSFALVKALTEYDKLTGLDETGLDRLELHLQTTLRALYRTSSETESVAGLIRFSGDSWRSGDQDTEKVWSVATGWGTSAAAEAAVLFEAHDRPDVAETLFEWATDLYKILRPDGPLTSEMGYFAEQVFDNGDIDSATPIGWSHALRLYSTAVLEEHDALPAPKSAPSGPGRQPRWTTGEKYGVGTVADHTASDSSRVWFTLTEGSLTELRYPRVDLMNFRTIDFLITSAADDSEYTARTHNETRRDDQTDTIERRAEAIDDESLLFRHVITETGDGRGHQWNLTVEYASDPAHDALLANVTFNAHDDNEYEVYVIANTALTNSGATDRGIRLGSDQYQLVARDTEAYDQTGETKPLLIDEHGQEYSVAAAITSTSRFDWATVSVAGSAYLSKLFSKGTVPEQITEVDDENVVLVGRVGNGPAVTETLAFGFAEDADTAGALGEAAGALTRGYETVRSSYIDSWNTFLADKPLPDSVAESPTLASQYRVSLMTLRAVEDKTFLGAGIASPSVPWGEAVAADEAKGYGYNFVWSRDLYQVFTVFDAVGDVDTATEALQYIYQYQQDDRGFIPQNTYLNGRTRWGGEQMDNISFPQVMAWTLRQHGVTFDNVEYGYQNIKRSADYVARNGPPTAQERWEEESGYSPSSIAAEIAGLACAGDIAIEEGHTADALTWLALADEWTQNVETWTATDTGTDRHPNTPYYVRVTRDGNPDAGQLRTLANNGPTLDEREIIDAGFLELVRLGIKPATDETIRNSIAEVDSTIRVDTPQGPAFYRYNGDGYGERAVEDEGAPWSVESKGKGRLWPIFTGERGEYELMHGTESGELTPQNLLETMAGFANSGRMIAEQVWDREHGTEYNWIFGEGTGAATPLAWSMAQYVRLAHGIDAGEPIEMPAVVRNRYVETDRPEGPLLQVSTRFAGDDVIVSGRTDAAIIAVKTGTETAIIHPDSEDESFELALPAEHAENQLLVAAATDTDLEAAGTSVTRFRI
ncbi:MAG: glucoamylase related glycosyl hydrolase [Haloquadratum walsbyi J07HQW1]|jgi:glucan 1,4-alpha-glucosidase|uniref:Glucoamylase related glycosyl hydrolase n=1 Tax=Haloquadratum walsbyi J07HQW1 TaxID=1238424 RepID=U1PFL8_9EURY|nr:MAG: glucoamylase related glycosyl hydrolase [Haloquadratum walsbyi J07HQW1]